jgi:hypothetical protein
MRTIVPKLAPTKTPGSSGTWLWTVVATHRMTARTVLYQRAVGRKDHQTAKVTPAPTAATIVHIGSPLAAITAEPMPVVTESQRLV